MVNCGEGEKQGVIAAQLSHEFSKSHMTGSHMLLDSVYTPHTALQQSHTPMCANSNTNSELQLHKLLCDTKEQFKQRKWKTQIFNHLLAVTLHPNKAINVFVEISFSFFMLLFGFNS